MQLKRGSITSAVLVIAVVHCLATVLPLLQAVLGGQEAAVQRDQHEGAGHELAVPLQDLEARHLLPQWEGFLPAQDCCTQQGTAIDSKYSR